MLIFDKQHEEYQVVGYKQFDNKRPLKAQFLDGGQPMDLSQYEISFECKKPDGNIVVDDESIVIKSNNEIELMLNDQVTVVNGEVRGQFVLIDKISRKRDTTFTFDMDIQQSVLALNGYSHSVVTIAERFHKDVEDAKNLHVLLTDDIKVGTPLQAQLNSDIKEASKWKDQLQSDVAEGKVLSPILKNDVIVANTAREKLESSIAEAQDDIAVIESTGNETVTVLASEWTYNNESKMYEKEVTHQCASENIHITCKSSDTKDALFLPWRIIDKSKILLKSDEAIGVTLVINARYYKATQTVSDNIAEEVVTARQGKADLLTNMNRKINYENFTGNSIN